MNFESLIIRQVLVCASGGVYWLGVLLLVAYIRRRTDRSANLVPQNTKERVLWVLWLIIIVGWIAQPLILLELAEVSLFAISPTCYRLIGLICGTVLVIGGQLGTYWCYATMGDSWRVGVDRDEGIQLVTRGPYAAIRHPIYSFQSMMLIGTACLLPTQFSCLIVALQLICIYVKAVDEEIHLTKLLGRSYKRYLAGTGRFLPRLIPVTPEDQTLPGRLNAFQRMMLNWEEVRAFNAVHVVGLNRHISTAQVEATALRTLAALGVNSIEFDAAHRRYKYFSEGPSPEFRILKPSGDWRADLSAEVASQLNRPFPNGRHVPFRLFYVEAGSGFYLGLAYQHVIGDASSISLLMQRMLDQLLSAESHRPDPIELYPPTTANSFSSDLSWSRWPAVALGFTAELFGFLNCYLLPFGDQRNSQVGFKIIGCDLPTCALVATARHYGVKVQDLVFAALLESFAKLIPYSQRAQSRRPNFALMTAVDLKRHTHGELDNSLGAFLSSYAVRHPTPEGIEFRQLVKDVSLQTERVKRQKTYFKQPAMYGVMNLIWPLLPRVAKIQPLRYVFPVMGGISNMNLTEKLSALPVTNYLRAASTGPDLPLILDITTVGERFNLTLMYRESAFRETQIDQIASHLRWRLVHNHPTAGQAALGKQRRSA